MQYRSFPRIPGLRVSTLGFGCMRLPTIGGETSNIDEQLATTLLHDAIDAGVNYVDTAWPYHGGASELFVGRALKGAWRGRVQLATKLPMWMVKTERDFEDLLEKQLKKLDTGHIDFYLFHGLDAARWETLRSLGGIEAMERAKADGRVRHIGFSFHDSLDVFRKVVDGYDWEFCQIQLNYLDEGYQAGIEGMRYATERKVGVIAMEPLRGGALANTPPEVAGIWARSGRKWSSAEWALRWVLNHEEVACALSGMNSATQVSENIRAAATMEPLGALELALVDEVRRLYESRMLVPCTTCGYCQPCPSGVDIAQVLSLYNACAMFKSNTQPSAVYRMWVMGSGADAGKCSECHDCEPRCPQHIAIPDRLQEAHRHLTTP